MTNPQKTPISKSKRINVSKVMKRRGFLKTTLAAFPLSVAVAQLPDAQRKPFYVGSGGDRRHEHAKLGGSTPNDCKVSATDTDGALCVFEFGPTSELGGPPRHLHYSQDEWFYVLEGEFELEVGDEKFRLKAGDSAFAPRRFPHAWAKVGNRPGRMLCAYQPAGTMEEFWRQIGKLNELSSPEQLEKLFSDHGMKISGPPPLSPGPK